METGMKYYMRAAALEPESRATSIGWIDANENMGICMNALGKYEEAIPYLKKVLKQQPNRRVSLRQLRRAEDGIKDK
jgi:Tfp pilus assembly protein PilF